MLIRAKIPTDIFLYGDAKDALEGMSTDFSHEGLNCTLRVVVAEPVHLKESNTWVSTGATLEFVIDDLGTNELQQPVKELQDGVLVKLIVAIANRCIARIRNVGLTALHVLNVDDEGDHLATLQTWNAKHSLDGKVWASFRSEITNKGLAASFIVRHSVRSTLINESPELDVAYWPEIEEAIQGNVPIQPEQEFVTNALEHLRFRNLRLAVVESIIGLEIVLTRFIREYLAIEKKVPNNRVQDFLSPNFSLKIRLAGILDLCLPEDQLRKIDLNKVRKVVGWRNDVVHKNGRLPQVEEETVKDGLASVFQLIFLLADKTREIRVSPEVKEIVAKIFSKHPNFGYPAIRIYSKHRASVDFFVVGTEAEASSTAPFEDLVADVVRLLKERDKLFEPEKHLAIRFYRLPRELMAAWYKGKFHMREQLPRAAS